jgi:uncharacterized membrane protein
MRDAKDGPRSGLERPLLLVMSLLYVGAGVMHFLTPKVFARIVPPRLPRPLALVYLSGLAEILLGIGVLFRRTRRRSAWGLVALLVAVFPANVHMATNTVLPESVPERGRGLARVALWVRLPLQAVLVAWALRYTRPPSADAE